ncbi:hypothetical protein HK105_202673 [Polyrhizophydium stewartii]|uniref:F5/8 type C domain-containing protein n=1 Tax=Polyrhizophydium stewartii TaxID=2732419 RepID=A0ABR4NE56_9FUNG
MPGIPLTADQLRVSSVLNRDARNFGKKHLVDGSTETCWNSDQGSPQWVQIDAGDGAGAGELRPTALRLMFQGGFAGKECELIGQRAQAPAADWEPIVRFFPEDSNALQTFSVPAGGPGRASGFRRLRVVFHSSTDFYGRITLYVLEIESE